MGRKGFTAAWHGSGSRTGVICDCTFLSHSISLLFTAHNERPMSVKPPGLRKGSLDPSLSLSFSLPLLPVHVWRAQKGKMRLRYEPGLSHWSVLTHGFYSRIQSCSKGTPGTVCKSETVWMWLIDSFDPDPHCWWKLSSSNSHIALIPSTHICHLSICFLWPSHNRREEFNFSSIMLIFIMLNIYFLVLFYLYILPTNFHFC